MLELAAPTRGKVILGVAASDAHVVANHLIAHVLRAQGYDVVNLGACTSVAEFAAACEDHPKALALLIGSHNGHALQDLRGLRAAKSAGRIHCPVVLGGNLSVGSQKNADQLARLKEEGVDAILGSYEEIPAFLRRVEAAKRRSAS